MPLVLDPQPQIEGGSTAGKAVRATVTGFGLTLLQVGDTTGLSPDYEHVYRRLQALHRASPRAKRYAWKWLRTWGQLLACPLQSEVPALGLPAPWSYTNEDGAIEFEWESPTRHLTLTLADDQFQYATQELMNGWEVDREGLLGIADVPTLLRWVLSG